MSSKRTCMLTGVEFSTSDPHSNISPSVMENIVREIKSNPSFRKEVMTATMLDGECLKLVGLAVMNCKAADVGLNAPGTVAEFFCGLWNTRFKQKASKVSEEV